jgi:ribosomal protein S18 acetylase RimI-like enzyme
MNSFWSLFVCSTPLVETDSAAEIVDLSSLRPRDLQHLWDREIRLWGENLYWDISSVVTAVRRAVDRKSLKGKAARMGRHIMGYSYYMVEGRRAVLGSLMLAGATSSLSIVSALMGSLLASLESDPAISRIESQFINFDTPWLAETFLSRGFKSHSRVFLRRSLNPLTLKPTEIRDRPSLEFESWSTLDLTEASVLLQKAHSESVDAEMNELYRTRDGCRTMLDNILHQQGCGRSIPVASFIAREPDGDLVGLVISTEISLRHAHLAQVAVSPDVQGQGIGRAFLHRALSALSGEGYQTVSLMVSGANERACSLYRSMAFEDVLRFPVFSRDYRGTIS